MDSLLQEVREGEEGRRERKQKRGCWAGLLARLKRQLHKLQLPSIFLPNDRFFADLELQMTANKSIRDCCVLLLMETWLHPLMTNAALPLARLHDTAEEQSELLFPPFLHRECPGVPNHSLVH